MMEAPGPGIRNGGKQVTSLHTARGGDQRTLFSRMLKIVVYLENATLCTNEMNGNLDKGY